MNALASASQFEVSEGRQTIPDAMGTHPTWFASGVAQAGSLPCRRLAISSPCSLVLPPSAGLVGIRNDHGALWCAGSSDPDSHISYPLQSIISKKMLPRVIPG
jgi:hypothetical protein